MFTSNQDMDVLCNPWAQIASLIREAGKGPQGWTSPAAAAAAAAAEARAAAAAAAEGVFSGPSSACATPLGATAAGRLDVEVHDTVAAAAALLELSTGRKRRLTFDNSQDGFPTDSEEAGSPAVQCKPMQFKESSDADGISDGHSSDHTYCMQGSPASTAVSKQQPFNTPSAANTPAGPFSPTTPASGPFSPASASAAAAAAAAAAVSNAGTSPPPVELLPHQRRVQLHMIEQMLDATNTKFSTNNGVVAPRKFWPRLEGGDTAPTQLQVLVHPPSWSTADYVSTSLERLAAAVVSNNAAALSADDGSTIAYAALWQHYLEQTEADELQQHYRLPSNNKGNLHAATADGRSLTFGPYPALVVAGGSMMRIRGIKHNGELKLLINTPHTLVLREKLGAHMLRLHVVLNSSDGDEMLRQPDLAVLTGKAAGSREQAMDMLMAEHRTSGRGMPQPQQKNRYILQQQVYHVANTNSSGGSARSTPPPSGRSTKQQRLTPPPQTLSPQQASDAMPHILALAGEMAAAAAAAAAAAGGAAGGADDQGMGYGAEPAPADIAQAIAAAMEALRRRQQEVQLHQNGME